MISSFSRIPYRARWTCLSSWITARSWILSSSDICPMSFILSSINWFITLGSLDPRISHSACWSLLSSTFLSLLSPSFYWFVSVASKSCHFSTWDSWIFMITSFVLWMGRREREEETWLWFGNCCYSWWKTRFYSISCCSLWSWR